MDNWVIIKLFSYLRLRQSRVKQEVDMPQIQKCVTRYSSPSWCSVPTIRKLACLVPKKNVTEIFCVADDNDNARRQKWSLYVALAKAGRRHKNCSPSPAMVMSPYEWDILEWDEKPKTNEQNQLNKLEYPSHTDALCLAWLLEKKTIKSNKCIMIYCNYFPLKKGMALQLNKEVRPLTAKLALLLIKFMKYGIVHFLFHE